MRSRRRGLGERPPSFGRIEAISSREVEFRMDVDSKRARQCERTLERAGGCSVAPPPQGTPPGGGEPLPRPLGESRIGVSELLAVTCGLLQVVADDLVELDQLRATLLEPPR